MTKKSFQKVFTTLRVTKHNFWLAFCCLQRLCYAPFSLPLRSCHVGSQSVTAIDSTQTGLSGIVVKQQHKQQSGLSLCASFHTNMEDTDEASLLAPLACVFTERGQWKSMEGKSVAWSDRQNLARIIITSYCFLEIQSCVSIRQD